MRRHVIEDLIRMMGAPRARLVAILGLSVALVVVVPGAAVAAPGWVAPVNATLWGGFHEPATHMGVDLGAQRFVPIRAASAGTVVVKKCNASLDGEPYSCDVDGSPQVKGCGWYIDIAHAAGVVTRYCHMVAEPLVDVGDRVETGQRIGYVGTSGNSSGPHLHFEVHLVPDNGYASNDNAIDPLPFMAKRGATLGIGADAPEPPGGSAAEPVAPPEPRVPVDGRSDVDGDGLTDLVVWRPAEGQWYIRPAAGGLDSAAEPQVVPLGVAGDVPVVADYDGDGKDDLAVWRPSDGRWLVQPTAGAPLAEVALGELGDIPVPGDYNGDGFAEFAVYRPYGGQWFVQGSADPIVFGQAGDLPVAADYDGDGLDDLAVWRPSDGRWYVRPSAEGATAPEVALGAEGDVPLTGDFDGDGKADFSVWQPNVGVWTVVYSTGAPAQPIAIGVVGDEPVVGDYDGDTKDDIAIWRRTDGQWLILPSSGEPLTTAEPATTGEPATTAEPGTESAQLTTAEQGAGIVFGAAGDLPANRPQWLDKDGKPPVLGETLLRDRARRGGFTTATPTPTAAG
jgi:pyruvate/2-oxoglutarate dehydrogenase complex dihydrolipoamide acyltransferase (E2) component